MRNKKEIAIGRAKSNQEIETMLNKALKSVKTEEFIAPTRNKDKYAFIDFCKGETEVETNVISFHQDGDKWKFLLHKEGVKKEFKESILISIFGCEFWINKTQAFANMYTNYIEIYVNKTWDYANQMDNQYYHMLLNGETFWELIKLCCRG